MLQVSFLGVGAALPATGQTNCSFLIEAAGACILFDCGPAVLQQLAGVGRTPGDVTHLFVSHAHGDHALGWPMFRLWWLLEHKDGPLQRPAAVVVSSEATYMDLFGLWTHCYAGLPEPVPVSNLFLPSDRPGEAVLPGTSIRLRTWPMVHSERYPVLGARFEIGERVLAFTADTARCENVVELARGADL